MYSLRSLCMRVVHALYGELVVTMKGSGTMNVLAGLIDLLHDPRAMIAGWIVALGPFMVYAPLFAIVFLETGLVFFPFLPGDSLLFATGVFSNDGTGLHVGATIAVFSAAAILGNTSNYCIARVFGARIIDSGRIKSLTPERLKKLDEFFERWGGITIIITRFMPFFRTFAPFIAGTGHMNFLKFTFYNAVGGILWVCTFVLAGYFFGTIPFLQHHFKLIALVIVLISLLPASIALVRKFVVQRRKKND